jgi:pyridoxine 4-dehydrogenase
MTDSTSPRPTPGGTSPLGHRTVSRMGYGAMQLESLAEGTRAERSRAIELLRSAVEQGVNHIDTAAFYGDASSNGLIREALAPYPDDLVIVTKVGARYHPATRIVTAQKPEELRAEVETNLATLGVDQVDVVNLRRADIPPGIIAEGDQIVDLDSQLAELIALRDAGKIGAIGLSNITVDQLRAALGADIVCVQNAHSVLDRSSEAVLDVCREHDIAWAPYFPLGSAFARLPKVADNPVVIAVAEAMDATPAQVGLAWQLAHYDRTLIISGTSDAAHLRENLAAGDIRFDTETLAKLDAIARTA